MSHSNVIALPDGARDEVTIMICERERSSTTTPDLDS